MEEKKNKQKEAEYIFAKALLDDLKPTDWSKNSWERLKDTYLQSKVSYKIWERYVKEEINKNFNINFQNELMNLILARQEDDATELIVEKILEDNFIYTTRDDIKSEIWIYDNGIYKPNGMSYIQEAVREFIGKAYTPQRANKIIAKIEVDTMIDTDEFFNSMYLDEICVENGILNLKTKEIYDFTPEKIFFNKLPIKYNPEATCPYINKFFEEILKDKEDKIVLYELIGFCLHKEYFIEKAFMFVGDGRNGKGKTLSLIKNFLGAENTCSVRLTQMEPQNTALCELHNRLVNLAGDLNNTALKDTGLLKEITARDSVQVKRKYLRDLIFTNYAKIVFACNELPRVYDMSLGFWSRWVLLEFPYNFLPQSEIDLKTEEEKIICKLQDPNVLNKIITPGELSGLLNESIKGLDRLKENKNFSYSRGTASIKDFWVRNSDSFTSFCLDNLEEDIDNWVTKKSLRKEFSRFCKEYKLRGTSDKNIKAVMENMFGVVEGRKGDRENQEHVWEGIKFKQKVL
ncbi:MAG TPA: phage/plasmid primase, P4 family [Candidatus Paceibacterota bacterium]|nr:phage/plasmid primase, P4 family [Candidatus Paceibacterota bacterium]